MSLTGIKPGSKEAGIPHVGLESSFSFLREGYTFISRVCDHYGVDAFRTRIMLTPAVCMRGAEAAEIFYGGDRFSRKGSMPKSVLHLLQDERSVQQLEGPAHRVRKRMFLGMMHEDALRKAVSIFGRELRSAFGRWGDRNEIRLLDGMRDVLTRTVFEWAGVPVVEAELDERIEELGAMVDDAGEIGPANWHARHLRNRCEAWAKTVIDDAREGRLALDEGSALAIIARHQDVDGRMLDPTVAAVELLNVLRPTIAIDRFVVFSALALYERPDWGDRLRDAEDADLEAFVLEVRRYYPFFPIIGGKVARQFDWKDHRFEVGDWVLFDLYGTNHHEASWEHANQFRPERFLGWKGDAFSYVAQGAGLFEDNHRCPGEWLTIAILKEAVRLFAGSVRYDVPVQDLSIDLSEMPALPKSGLLVKNVSWNGTP
jgi:fatty-acid peroxygenase